MIIVVILLIKDFDHKLLIVFTIVQVFFILGDFILHHLILLKFRDFDWFVLVSFVDRRTWHGFARVLNRFGVSPADTFATVVF